MNQPEDTIDLHTGQTHRVRLYRHGDPQPTIVYEGDATFTVTPAPLIRRLAPRWHISVDCLPGHEATTGGRTGPTPYRTGDSMIEFGERYLLYLLDREDPERPYGPDGPTLREALEMHLDTWAAGEGITSIRFE